MISDQASSEATVARPSFHRRLLRRTRPSLTFISWRPPALPCHGAAILAGPLNWEVEFCHGSLATARIGLAMPWASYYLDLVPWRPRVTVCGDRDLPPAADQPAEEEEAPAEPVKVATAYDRLFEERMLDLAWAAGYRQARERIDTDEAKVASDRAWDSFAEGGSKPDPIEGHRVQSDE
jgi:hypothetical protein